MDMPANAKMQTISGKKYVFIDTPYWNAEKHPRCSRRDMILC